MTSSNHRTGRGRHNDLPPVAFTLLSDTGGEIKRIAMKIPLDLPPDIEGKREAYNALFKAIANCTSMGIVAVAADSAVADVTTRLIGAGFEAPRYLVLSVPEADFKNSNV